MQRTLNDIILEFLTIVNYPNNKENFIAEFDQINHLEALTNIFDTLPQETKDKIKASKSPLEVRQLLPREAYLQELAKVSGLAFAQHINDTLPLLDDEQKEKIKQLLTEAQKLSPLQPYTT